MPELSRFFGIIIAMYYNDHLRRTFTRNMAMTKPLLGSTAVRSWRARSAPALDGSSMSGASCTKQSCLKTGPELRLVSP